MTRAWLATGPAAAAVATRILPAYIEARRITKVCAEGDRPMTQTETAGAGPIGRSP